MISQQSEIDVVIQKLAMAWHHGRAIVPMLGIGISAECGIPTTEGLVRYLARFHSYVRNGAYLPPDLLPDLSPGHPLSQRTHTYSDTLFEFVKEHKWPDAFELTEDLWYFREEKEKAEKAKGGGTTGQPGQAETRVDRRWLEDETVKQLDELAGLLYPDQVSYVKRVESRDDHPLDQRRSALWDIMGQWRDLIRHVTNFDRDYAEALFSRFQKFRRPGLSHRFLAFLARYWASDCS